MAKSESDGESSTFDIQSVSRVGHILGLFGPQRDELTAAFVAERLGLNRTTAYRYCTSLVSAGILERGRRRGTFVLGGLMLQLGIHALHRRRVVDIAPPFLRELSAEAGTTAVLSLWGARGPVVALVQENTSRTVVVTVHAGSELDATSAQMRVFLAHLTDHTLTERMMEGLSAPQRVELEAGIYAVRRAGYSLVALPDGLFGAAAPVFDEYGICATIALIGAEQLADTDPESSLVSALKRTASSLSDELGGERPGDSHGHVR